MGLLGRSNQEEEPGYGEIPTKPNFNQLSNVLFCRVVDKVSSRGARHKRAVILSSEAVVICEARSFDVRRIVYVANITKAILQEDPVDPRLHGPREGQALLLKIPNEHDIVLALPKKRRAGYARRSDLVALAHAIALCKKSQGARCDVITFGTSDDLLGKADLVRLSGHKVPTITTFDKLDALLETHKPLPDAALAESTAEEPSIPVAPSSPAVLEAPEGRKDRPAPALLDLQPPAVSVVSASEDGDTAFESSVAGQRMGRKESRVSFDGQKSSHFSFPPDTAEAPLRGRSDIDAPSIKAVLHRRHNPYHAVLFNTEATYNAPPVSGKSLFNCDARSALAERKRRDGHLRQCDTLLHNAVHRGQWRGDHTELKCSMLGQLEGALCAHDGFIAENHWSCCGATDYNVPYCTRPAGMGEEKAPGAVRDAGPTAATCQVCTQLLLSTADERHCARCHCLACPVCCGAHFSLRLPPESDETQPKTWQGAKPPRIGPCCKVCFAEVRGEGAMDRAKAAHGTSPGGLYCQVCVAPLSLGNAGGTDPGYCQCAHCGCLTCPTCGSYSLRVPHSTHKQAAATYLRMGVVVAKDGTGAVQVCKACFQEARENRGAGRPTPAEGVRYSDAARGLPKSTFQPATTSRHSRPRRAAPTPSTATPHSRAPSSPSSSSSSGFTSTTTTTTTSSSSTSSQPSLSQASYGSLMPLPPRATPRGRLFDALPVGSEEALLRVNPLYAQFLSMQAAAVAAAVCIAACGCVREALRHSRRAKREEKRRRRLERDQQQGVGAVVPAVPPPYSTPYGRSPAPQHPAAALFGQRQGDAWQRVGTAMSPAVWSSPPAITPPPTQRPAGDQFWTGFLKEWDSVSHSL